MQRVLRRAQEEDGFTLIELMVVVMILAILIVMGLPTFLGVKARFQDRAAQTDLRNTVLAARILFTDNATFSSANETAHGPRPDRAQHVLRGRRNGVCREWNRPVRQRRRRWVHQRRVDSDAVLRSADGDLDVVLRDPGRHHRNEIRT